MGWRAAGCTTSIYPKGRPAAHDLNNGSHQLRYGSRDGGSSGVESLMPRSCHINITVLYSHRNIIHIILPTHGTVYIARLRPLVHVVV